MIKSPFPSPYYHSYPSPPSTPHFIPLPSFPHSILLSFPSPLSPLHSSPFPPLRPPLDRFVQGFVLTVLVPLVPGYYVCALTVDKLGHRVLQVPPEMQCDALQCAITVTVLYYAVLCFALLCYNLLYCSDSCAILTVLR